MGNTVTTTTNDREAEQRHHEETPLVVSAASAAASAASDVENVDEVIKTSSSNKTTRKDGNDEDAGPPTILQDCVDIVRLGVPIFISMLSWVGMKTTDTALLGHVSADALAAAALSDLYTMCSAVLVQARVLTVLTGPAIGAGNPALAGIYLHVSIVVLGIITVGIIVCWFFTEQVWRLFGSDPAIASMAGYYAKILAAGLPAQLVAGQLAQLLQSMQIMYPEVIASLVALATNLVVGLIMVLGVPVPHFNGFGFTACPIVTAVVSYIQLYVLYYFFIERQQLLQPCFPNTTSNNGNGNGGGGVLTIVWKEITWNRVHTFIDLYLPAALGLASDFWRVAVIGLIAANMGELEVAVFNTSYRIMWICLILISAISMAASIKMTRRFGSGHWQLARQVGLLSVVMATLVLFVLGILIVWKIRWFGLIFTTDPMFLDEFEAAAVPFTTTLVLMNLAVAIERIPYSMGRTRAVFWMGFVASWAVQVPACYGFVKYWRNDLYGLYCGMTAGYLILVVLYGSIVLTSDWQHYALLARQRSEISSEEGK